MDPATIDLVLSSLEAGRWGWHRTIPECNFLGQPIGLHIETRPVPREELPPKPDTHEESLARFILGQLPLLLPEIERRYREKYALLPDRIAEVRASQIWLSREFLADKPENWTFVVGLTGSAEFGIHCEFKRTTLYRIWAGD